MKQSAISFRSGTLNIHGYCYYPETTGKYPAVIICHPHPLNGGSMSNTVVRKLGEVLVNRSIVALMFNYRGVGKSEGSYGGGIGEQDDLVAALDFIGTREDVDQERIGTAGYSFGASVALPVASRDDRVKALAMISPALNSTFIPYLKKYNRPKLFISGTKDNLFLPENVTAWSNEAAEPKQLELIEGADHFWFGREGDVAEKVTDYFERLFTTGGR